MNVNSYYSDPARGPNKHNKARKKIIIKGTDNEKGESKSYL